MADQPEVVERPAGQEIIAPGYTFGTVTDQIAAVVLTRQDALFWLACFAAGSGLLLLFLLAVTVLWPRAWAYGASARR